MKKALLFAVIHLCLFACGGGGSSTSAVSPAEGSSGNTGTPNSSNNLPTFSSSDNVSVVENQTNAATVEIDDADSDDSLSLEISEICSKPSLPGRIFTNAPKSIILITLTSYFLFNS